MINATHRLPGENINPIAPSKAVSSFRELVEIIRQSGNNQRQTGANIFGIALKFQLTPYKFTVDGIFKPLQLS